MPTVFDLGLAPPANDFCNLEDSRHGFAPLKVLLCESCKLSQLSVVVDPGVLYSNYKYVTSNSATMQRHFNALCDDLEREQGKLGKVLEIGSNDGRFLKYLKNLGASPVGCDPADNLDQVDPSIPVVRELFNWNSAARINDQFDIVIARHCLAHIDDWIDFVQALELVTHDKSLIAIEVPYVMDTLENGEFDQIYFEHLSFVSVTAIERLLKDSSFYLKKVIHYPIHGGSIVLFIRRKGEGEEDQSVALARELESSLTVDRWLEFEKEVRFNINALTILIRKAQIDQKTICGLGASAKSSTWVHACGFTREDIQFITDTTPHKQGKLSPGSDIPIIEPEALLRHQPDYCIIFAWNFSEEIISKNREYLDRGGKFIIPIPKVRIVEH